MKKLLTLLFTVITFNIFGQSPTYLDSIYPVDIQTNIQYGKARNVLHLSQPLYTDIYSPIGLDNINKPTILLAHGGSFIGGSKNDSRLVVEAKYLAGCGYVVFCYDYRIGWKLNTTDTVKSIINAHKAYYRAIQDGFTLVRFAKYYSNIYDIDTSNIFVGGTSAGGMIAVGIGYLDQNEVESYFTPPLKTNGNTLTKYINTDIKGVISYWGGGFDTSIFQNGEPDNICFHGTNDKVVYYNYGKFKGMIPIFGGYKVYQKSIENNIPSVLHSFIDANHGVGFPSEEWDSCLNETVSWLHEKLFNQLNLKSINQPSVPRKVLSEYICATTCGPCSIFSPTMRALMNTNSDKVVYIERHTNIPSADAFYSQGWPYSTWYKVFNQVTGNPIFFWDGKFHFTNDANQTCLDSIYSKPSYLEINSTYYLSPDKDSVFITANLNPLSDISGDLYLHTNVKMGDPVNHDAYMFSPILGEMPIDSLIANQSVSYTIGQLIPTTWTMGYNKDSLKVITYVQTHINSNPNVNEPPSHEVFNAAYAVKLSQGFLPLSVTNQTGNVICPNSGWVSQTVSGGTSPYSYLWSNGMTDEDIADLTAGTYNCTITSGDGQNLATAYTLINVALATPTNITFSNITTTKVKVNCFTVPYANKYQFQLKLTGTSSWTNREVLNHYTTFSSLIPNTAYDVRVRARCKTGLVYKNSQWSSIQVVNTAMRTEDPYEYNPIIYIYDIMGREVYRGYEVPKLPNGTYIKLQDTIISKIIIIN